MHTLAEAIARWTSDQENCPTPIPNLSLYRRDMPTPPIACLVEPSIVLVAQGAKQLMIGEQSYRYDAERFMVTSLNLPGISQVLEASPQRPCLGLVYKLDLRTITELATHGSVPPPANIASQGAAAIGRLTPTLEAPFRRLLALLNEPQACPVLAPLIEREIHYRLLLSDQAARLRLNEARRLMLNEHLDAASAAFQDGYESPSQFSREYSRQFGAPPRRDIDTMRREVALAI